MFEINKNLEKLQFSGIAKVIEKANSLGEDVIRLEVGDVDLDAPQEIKIGIEKAFNDKKTHYPPLRGDAKLIEMIANESKNNINKFISKDNIIITPGGSMGMFYIFSTLLNYKDEVIVIEPIWPHLNEMIKSVGAVPVSVGLTESNDFHIDFENL